ncbi:aminotransferase class V-fold PLP-dependent enzyme [Prosthecochloris sp. N3]|uniref:cysteine desulfurase n=1 Tax=Prosthecochloris ethylica TaxID=2743976 RepID=A0ABR9XP26_9CHLB|nr:MULTISPECIES: aminotransferase class V-fold PLP-dependent enzyme [Prosthecochloris]MBF0585810.1 aminotransferase class V-fold PLP-dependent enzyme [Prosthecochloris ethylica]MBF0635720.1 aminotransferase class V-fold PLP-dependent enzyme [Prosthecochloris ethylica]NUK47018.1 aminotransferase class V-fold PLP-dependent enzyme [Prosthecochloris ethylica]RNA65501.1 aminotransferase class V-fold PLP-dependent enzyme [Prosthecochloris sp. ZM_2]
MKHRRIYLDNNATTPLHPEVKNEMVEAMEMFGNPSSMHAYGREARANVEHARRIVASFIGAHEDELVFVGSGSEANNTVLSLFACASNLCIPGFKARQTIVTTRIEHPCVLETSQCLAHRGTTVRLLDVDRYGRVDMDQLKEFLTDDVGLVSVMTANNEIGTVQDIAAISRMAHEAGALMHTDAVQAFGKLPLHVDDLGVDFLTMSAHKIYGPKGIGALYVRKGTPYCPFIRGGHQEKGRRAGTENTLGIMGLAKAVEMRAAEMEDEAVRLAGMKEVLRKGIEERIDDVLFNGHPEHNMPNTLNVSFPGAEGEAILLYLDLEGIAVSTGSACASGSLDPSHVLLATGSDAERAHGSIRISMGRETTMEDIEYVLDVLPGVISKIRSMSTAYIKGGEHAAAE